MNTKKLFMLLAAVLLGSVSAFAQSGNEEPLDGDANGDGVVNMADVTYVLNIIKMNAKQQQGNETIYYYYAGKSIPTEPVNPEENIKTDTGDGRQEPGWYKMGTTLPHTFVKSFRGDSAGQWYVVLPTEGYYRDTDSQFSGAGLYEQIGTIFIKGISYTLFKTTSTSANTTVYMASLKVTEIVER